MSEIDSNSEKSYDSDDSDIDYIPGYTNVEATEVKDANTVNEPAALTSSLDPHTYQPYDTYEPLLQNAAPLYHTICKSLQNAAEQTSTATDALLSSSEVFL